MSDRRRFLTVLSASVASVLVTACNDLEDPAAASANGSGGAGGDPNGASGAGGGATNGQGAGPTTLSELPSDCSWTYSKVKKVGPPSSYTTMGMHKAPQAFVLIGRDENGLYALTSQCTHKCCDLNQPYTALPGGEFTTGGELMPDGGILCGCHGSRYAADGSIMVAAMAGQTRLPAYALTLHDDGNLYVDLSAMIDPATRLVV